MMNLMARLMPSCREVTGLLASGELESVPRMKHLLVRLHLSMCAHCSRFARQLRVISRALRAAWVPSAAPGADALKSRILERLRSI